MNTRLAPTAVPVVLLASIPRTDPSYSILNTREGGRRFLSGEFGAVNCCVQPSLKQLPFQTKRGNRRFTGFVDAVHTNRCIGLSWALPRRGQDPFRPALRRGRGMG